MNYKLAWQLYAVPGIYGVPETTARSKECSMANQDPLWNLLGAEACKVLESKLKDLISGNDGWQKTALALVADAVAKNGPAGINMAIEAIHGLLDGKHVQLDWADLRVASDVLATLENAEADRKSAMRTYVTQVSEVLGLIVAGIIKGMLAAA